MTPREVRDALEAPGDDKLNDAFASGVVEHVRVCQDNVEAIPPFKRRLVSLLDYVAPQFLVDVDTPASEESDMDAAYSLWVTLARNGRGEDESFDVWCQRAVKYADKRNYAIARRFWGIAKRFFPAPGRPFTVPRRGGAAIGWFPQILHTAAKDGNVPLQEFREVWMNGGKRVKHIAAYQNTVRYGESAEAATLLSCRVPSDPNMRAYLGMTASDVAPARRESPLRADGEVLRVDVGGKSVFEGGMKAWTATQKRLFHTAMGAPLAYAAARMIVRQQWEKFAFEGEGAAAGWTVAAVALLDGFMPVLEDGVWTRPRAYEMVTPAPHIGLVPARLQGKRLVPTAGRPAWALTLDDDAARAVARYSEWGRAREDESLPAAARFPQRHKKG